MSLLGLTRNVNSDARNGFTGVGADEVTQKQVDGVATTTETDKTEAPVTTRSLAEAAPAKVTWPSRSSIVSDKSLSLCGKLATRC